MNREQALDLLHKNMQNQNLRRHCYAVEAVMGALAERLGKKDKKETWQIAGLLHDADWEKTQENPQQHTKLITGWIQAIEEENELEDLRNAIISHAWGYVDGNREPLSKMEWALYCCDELTGLIVATTLVKPDKKLSSVTVDSVMNKWNEKSFARGVNRDQIKECEGRLEILLREFIEIALSAMQAIAPELGL